MGDTFVAQDFAVKLLNAHSQNSIGRILRLVYLNVFQCVAKSFVAKVEAMLNEFIGCDILPAKQ